MLSFLVGVCICQAALIGLSLLKTLRMRKEMAEIRQDIAKQQATMVAFPLSPLEFGFCLEGNTFSTHNDCGAK